jgi:hypothetical protein
VPIILAAAGFGLIIADELAFQVELHKPVSCPDGLVCDKVIVRDALFSVLGIASLISSGIVFTAGRLVWPDRAMSSSNKS